MKRLFSLIITLLLILPLNAIDLIPGLDRLYHPVTTENKEAQQFFDQGLTLIYAFNHDAAYLSFQKAAELDPHLAMAYWGMALSIGQNINMDITAQNEEKAFQLIERALSLQEFASPVERDYILALSKRYSNDPKVDKVSLRSAYKDAMEKLSKKYPEDLDAAVLYGESLMNLRPWHLWTNDNEPVEGTLELVELLETVLTKNPNHLGANHYYIHAIEGSKHPEYALMSAQRMETLLPASGHFLHMPSHIYYLVGDYSKAAKSNEQAIKADLEYIKQYGLGGIYPLHYLSHNYYFLCRSLMMEGNFDEAYKVGSDLVNFYAPHSEHDPGLEYYTLAPMQVLLRFHRWEEALKMPQPSAKFQGGIVFWRYARALSFGSLGNLKEAQRECDLFLEGVKNLPKGKQLGSNSAETLFEIAQNVLAAKFAKSNKDNQKVIHHLNEAVRLQDSLHYNEPPDWYFPVRETLAMELFLQNRIADAIKVFLKDLEKNRRNPRSLFGLFLCYRKENKDWDAFWVNSEFEKAWRNSTTGLNIESLAL